VSRTFEELATGELDALYQGALFLSGGDRREAEQLLVDAVVLAFKEHTAEDAPTAVQRRLEAGLVRSFLGDLLDRPAPPPHPTPMHPAHGAGALDALDPDDLFAAAATLPAWPRAALYLVSLRRWSYGDAAHAVNVDVETMEGLLRYRDPLIQEMLTSSPARCSGEGVS
jgi:hypothetical protein